MYDRLYVPKPSRLYLPLESSSRLVLLVYFITKCVPSSLSKGRTVSVAEQYLCNRNRENQREKLVSSIYCGKESDGVSKKGALGTFSVVSLNIGQF